jgi:hypothetical protein
MRSSCRALGSGAGSSGEVGVLRWNARRWNPILLRDTSMCQFGKVRRLISFLGCVKEACKVSAPLVSRLAFRSLAVSDVEIWDER